MDKRGEEKEENLFAIFGTLVIAFFLVYGLYDIYRTVHNEAVAQDFVAKEIASSINSMSSLPGDAAVHMSFRKNYTISIRSDAVVVKKDDFDSGFSAPLIKGGGAYIDEDTLKLVDSIEILKQERRITLNER